MSRNICSFVRQVEKMCITTVTITATTTMTAVTVAMAAASATAVEGNNYDGNRTSNSYNSGKLKELKVLEKIEVNYVNLFTKCAYMVIPYAEV